jgi:peptide-methionine (S)-S-oxide reductase
MSERMTAMTERATFGAGCFWGIEAAFRELPGVTQAVVGYEGGTMVDPTYRDVCTGRTGHAEVVEVTYDPARTTYDELLETFWSIHDPTTANRQGPDEGTQYRSAIFFHSAEQRAAAAASLARQAASARYRRPIVTSIEPAQTFYRAEEYHQRYFQKNGIACHIAARPALAR